LEIKSQADLAYVEIKVGAEPKAQQLVDYSRNLENRLTHDATLKRSCLTLITRQEYPGYSGNGVIPYENITWSKLLEEIVNTARKSEEVTHTAQDPVGHRYPHQFLLDQFSGYLRGKGTTEEHLKQEFEKKGTTLKQIEKVLIEAAKKTKKFKAPKAKTLRKD